MGLPLISCLQLMRLERPLGVKSLNLLQNAALRTLFFPCSASLKSGPQLASVSFRNFCFRHHPCYVNKQIRSDVLCSLIASTIWYRQPLVSRGLSTKCTCRTNNRLFVNRSWLIHILTCVWLMCDSFSQKLDQVQRQGHTQNVWRVLF